MESHDNSIWSDAMRMAPADLPVGNVRGKWTGGSIMHDGCLALLQKLPSHGLSGNYPRYACKVRLTESLFAFFEGAQREWALKTHSSRHSEL
jgi:hypothetical protein